MMRDSSCYEALGEKARVPRSHASFSSRNFFEELKRLAPN